MSRQLPFGILWFFPSGRFALWCMMTACLAWLLTVMPPPPGVATAHMAELSLAEPLTGGLQPLTPTAATAAAALPILEGYTSGGFELGGFRLGGLDDVMLLLYAAGWTLAEVSRICMHACMHACTLRAGPLRR